MGENLISIIMSFIPLSLCLLAGIVVVASFLGHSERSSSLSHIQSTWVSPFPAAAVQPSPPSCHIGFSPGLTLLLIYISVRHCLSLRPLPSPLLTPRSERCVLKTPHSSSSTFLTICLCLSTEGKVLVCELLKANAYQLSSLPPQCVH